MKDIKSPGECQKTSQDFNESFCPLELPLLWLLNGNARVVAVDLYGLSLSSAWVSGFLCGDFLQLF